MKTRPGSCRSKATDPYMANGPQTIKWTVNWTFEQGTTNRNLECKDNVAKREVGESQA